MRFCADVDNVHFTLTIQFLILVDPWFPKRAGGYTSNAPIGALASLILPSLQIPSSSRCHGWADVFPPDGVFNCPRCDFSPSYLRQLLSPSLHLLSLQNIIISFSKYFHNNDSPEGPTEAGKMRIFYFVRLTTLLLGCIEVSQLLINTSVIYKHSKIILLYLRLCIYI